MLRTRVLIGALLRVHRQPNGRSCLGGNQMEPYSRPSRASLQTTPLLVHNRAQDTSEAAGTMGAMGRVAVVTGAASGMGLAIARHLAARGDRVGLLDLQGDAAFRAAEDLRETGATAIAAEADVSRPRGRRRRPRQGARGARTHRDHGHQRRSRLVRALHGHHDRELGAHPRHQPHRDVPLPAGRRSRHARSPLGSDGDDLVVERAVGCRAHGALRRVEGRRDRTHQGARAGARSPRDHGQHHPAGHDRHADAAPRRGRWRHREDRQARPPDDPRRPGRNPRRHRGDVRVPLLRRSGLHHRSGDRRQRRHGLCESTTEERTA